MNETDYNARLYEKMKADWQEDGVKVSKGAKSLSILEPVEYAKRCPCGWCSRWRRS